MKNPALALALTALIATPSFAQDHDGDGRVGFRDSVREAWYQLEDAGLEARENIAEALTEIKQKARDVRHERPLLLSEYVTVAKKGDRVVLTYCDTRLMRLPSLVGGRDRQGCEKLHNKSFKVDELKSCLADAGENKQPGLILNRQLTATSENGYAYDFFKMYDSKDSYKDYLKSCEASLSARRAPQAPRPPVAAAPRAKPVEEFKPFEPSQPQASDQSDTL